MAKYRTHVSFNLLVGYPLGAFLFFFYYSSSHFLFGLFSGSFLLSTLILNPDLDISHSVKLFSLRGLLTLPFRPYSYIFSHRGISHYPIIGTCTRIVYIGFFSFCIFLIIYGEIPTKKLITSLYEAYSTPFWVVLIGLIYADLCHILLDGKKTAT